MDSTRASLILRLQDADDVAAWDEFAAIYTPVIFRVAISRGFQAADADNLVQEVLLAVAGSITKWLAREKRGSFRAWLLRIALNESVDIMTRRATRPLGQDGEYADQVLANLPAPNLLSEELDLEYSRAVFKWAAARVRESIAEQTWEAFRLSSVEGLPVEQVARKLGTRPGNVYCARSRVMARIRELVRQYELET